MSEPKKSALDKLRAGLSSKSDDPLDALSVSLLNQNPWFSGHPAASIRGAPLQTDIDGVLSNRWESNHIQRLKLTEFKELYTKVRTDNLALTHEAAVELVKMIQREANTLSIKDIEL